MLSPGSPSLEIERSARSQYAVVAAVLAILAIVPWWLPQLSVGIAASLAVTTCVLAGVSFWRIGWLGGKRVLHTALWAGDGGWLLVDRAGASWSATLDPGSQVLGRLIWLRFASERGSRQMLLWGSDLNVDTRRRLVARLRLSSAAVRPESDLISESGSVRRDKSGLP